jgi:long-chain acyl-CoA synthetase
MSMSQPIYDAPTLAHLLAERFAAGRNDRALQAQLPDGEFQAISWRELQVSVDATVAVLFAAGVQPGDRVAQLSENRFEWILIDFACLLLQAVHVPLHASLSAEQALEQIVHSGARVLTISTRAQAEKFHQLQARWPAALRIIGYEDFADLAGDAWHGLLIALCQQTRVGEGYEVLKDYAANITPDTLATILYTSGTTGEPKGVMLTHGNLVSNASAAQRAFGARADEVKLGILPLSHVFARTCDLYSWLVSGGKFVLSSRRENVMHELAHFQPTTLNGVPYFFEKIYASLAAKDLLQTPGALQSVLGGKMRFCNSGGASLPPHLYDFYDAQGVPLCEGYGLSETSPVISLSTPESRRRGSVGRPIDGVEVRIADDGEILTRGPHVMHGYYRNAEATQDVLTSGWLLTGDLGRLDADGYLYVTGRKKELIVLSNGKNIAPVYLEGLLTAHPAIAQAMIVGDNRGYLTALVVPAALDHTHDAAHYLAIIENCLAHCSRHEQVRQITLLAEPFTLERDEVTPKLTLRRAIIAEHYAAEIAAMYATGDTF